MKLRGRQLTAAGVVLLASNAFAAMLYVDGRNPTPAPPFTNWLTAATNIQDAVDAAAVADEVLVANGIYATGGRAVVGTMTNRVVVGKPLAVRSVNGPQLTVIVGRQIPGANNGDGAIRCIHLASGARLSGFTLTRGATLSWNAEDGDELSGGGVWCESATTVVSNCVLTGNSSCSSGGGAYRGTLHDCTLTDNTTGQGGALGSGSGGGVASATLNRCALTGNVAAYNGGGAWNCTLDHCLLNGNRANVGGGGASGGTLNNCIVAANAASGWGGGGLHYATANNCTVTTNTALSYGGGAYAGTLNNSILEFNTAPQGSNYWGGTILNYCCTTPPPTNGCGNISLDPLFVNRAGGNLRVQSNSPCINAGCNAYAPNNTDWYGNPRVQGGTADIGAYEFPNPPSLISYAWLQGYGLPTDGTADFADPDGDGMDNWKEWICGTGPTNNLSVLQMLAPSNSVSGVTLRWQSVSGKTYCVHRGANPLQPGGISPLHSNIVGQAGLTSFTDTTAPDAGPRFYRVMVQR